MKKIVVLSAFAVLGLGGFRAWDVDRRRAETNRVALVDASIPGTQQVAAPQVLTPVPPTPRIQAVVSEPQKSMSAGPPGIIEERRRQIKAMFTRSFDSVHGPLYAQLGFTEAQRSTFRDLRFNSMERQQALARAAIKDPRVVGDREGMQLTGQVAAEVAYEEWQEAIGREFGENTAKQILAFQWKAPAREITNQMNSDVGEFGLGLSPAQIEQVVDLIAAHSPAGKTSIEVETLDIEKVCVEARRFLSEAQVSALRRANATVRAKFFPIGGRGPTAFRAQ